MKSKVGHVPVEEGDKGMVEVHIGHCSDACTLDGQIFRGIIEDKYYHSTYCAVIRISF